MIFPLFAPYSTTEFRLVCLPGLPTALKCISCIYWHAGVLAVLLISPIILRYLFGIAEHVIYFVCKWPWRISYCRLCLLMEKKFYWSDENASGNVMRLWPPSIIGNFCYSRSRADAVVTGSGMSHIFIRVYWYIIVTPWLDWASENIFRFFVR